MTVQCPRCGVANEVGSRFCLACGAPVSVQSHALTEPGGWVGTTPNPAQPGWSGGPLHPTDRLRLGEPRAADPYAATAQASDAWGLSRDAAFAAATPAGQQRHHAPPGRISGGPESMTLNSMRAGQDPEHVPAEAPRILAGFLVSYADRAGIFWPIFQGRNPIGRRGAANLMIAFDDPTISAHHAVILAAACPGRLKLEDQNSTNGTFVGKVRLLPGHPRELNDGDTVRFGALSTIVKIII